MSLLNDVLKDLSKERAEEPLLQVAANDLSYRFQQPDFNRSSLLRRGVLVAAIFIVVFLMGMLVKKQWKTLWVSNQHPVSTPIVASSITKDVETTVSKADEKQNTQINAETSVSNSLVDINAKTAPVNDDKVALLLNSAELAVINNRLTSPIEDNAYNWYKAVLDIDSENQQAKEGLEKLAKIYYDLAQGANLSGKAAQAKKYIERARYIAPAYVDELTQHEIHTGTTQETVVIGSESLAVPMSSQHETIKTFPVASEAGENSDSRANQSTEVQVNKSLEQQDRYQYEMASSLVYQHKPMEAIQQLKTFLVTNPNALMSAKYLVDIALIQGDVDAAEQALANISSISSIEKAQFTARILSARGEDNSAIQQLLPFLDANSNNENFLNLLAGLEHRSGRYSESLTHYQLLIRQFGEKTVYWLGLALAYDGLGKQSEALQSYQLLAVRNDMQPAVKNYITQRINALSSR